MKSNYEEKKAARLESYQRLAAQSENESTRAYEHSSKISSFIPMGQPILVGHHSEKRHRRDIAKIDNAMRRSVEASKKAKYYEERAESLLSNTTISSDDPNAIDKLQEKLERLQAQQVLYKQINKVVRSTKMADAEKVATLVAMGLKETTAAELLVGGRWDIGIPRYRLTNNNATIRNTKQRIEYLSKLATIPSSEKEINGVRFVISSEDNRVQLFFPGKPSEEVRSKLKRAAFRWAPSVGAWMRQISNSAIWQAEEILKALN